MNKVLDVDIKSTAFRKLNKGLGTLLENNDVRDAYDILLTTVKKRTVKLYSIYLNREHTNTVLSNYTQVVFSLFDEFVKNIPNEDNKKRKVGRLLTSMHEECISESLLSNSEMYIAFWEIFFMSKKTWNTLDDKTKNTFTVIVKYLTSSLIIYTGLYKGCRIEAPAALLDSVILKSDVELVEKLAEEAILNE